MPKNHPEEHAGNQKREPRRSARQGSPRGQLCCKQAGPMNFAPLAIFVGATSAKDGGLSPTEDPVTAPSQTTIYRHQPAGLPEHSVRPFGVLEGSRVGMFGL